MGSQQPRGYGRSARWSASASQPGPARWVGVSVPSIGSEPSPGPVRPCGQQARE